NLWLFYRAFAIQGTPGDCYQPSAVSYQRSAKAAGLCPDGQPWAAVPTHEPMLGLDRYLSTYFANICSGSMAMKVPLLRARTSPLAFTISAVLTWVRPRTWTSRPSTRSCLCKGTGFRYS